MKLPAHWRMVAFTGLLCFTGCVSQVHHPGPVGHPFNRLQPGQGYGDMVRELGPPDHSFSEDRSGRETAVLFVPGWNLLESMGDFNPSSVQRYTYDRCGTIVIGNNKILRIEAKETADPKPSGG